MSFSDWEFQRAYSSVDLLAPDTGWPQENSALTNPLADSGTHCRRFEGSFSSAGFTDNPGVVYRLKLINANYINVSTDQAISLRAKIRIKAFNFAEGTDIYNKTYQQYIGVGSYFADMATGATTNQTSFGYGLGLQAYFPNNGSLSPIVRLVLLADDNTGNRSISATSGNDYAVVATCSGTYNLDNWYHIRLDVIPNSISSTFLKAYISSDNGNTWSQVGEYYVDQIVNVRFRTAGNNGIIARIVGTRGGDRPQWDDIDAQLYVDDFKLNTELAI